MSAVLLAVVTYRDGREVTAEIGPRAQVEVERRFPELQEFADVLNEKKSNLEKIYFMCWAAVHYDGQDDEADFDTWLSSIKQADADLKTEGTPTKKNPTQRARKPANSSGSAS